MTMLKIGEHVELLPPLKPGRAVVVDLIPANAVPDGAKVEKYYQPKPGEYFGGVRRATKTNRWILQRNGGGYVVLPENWRNAQMFNPLIDEPKPNSVLHPCKCTSYNGGQCYNCLNGAHNLCADGCKTKRSKQIGVMIAVKQSKRKMPAWMKPYRDRIEAPRKGKSK